MEKVVALESAIEDVAGQLYNLLVCVCRLEIADQEGMGAGDGDLVLEGLENGFLCLDDFVAGIGAVAHIDEVSELRWVNLLVLGSD